MRKIVAALSLCLISSAACAYDYVAIEKQYDSLMFKMPTGAAFAGDSLLVTDSKAGAVFIFNPNETTPRKITGKSGGEPLFRSPIGAASGKNGRIYVLDGDAGCVRVVDADGNLLFTFGSRGSKPGQFSEPRAIVSGADGRIYVADTGNSRVQVFTPDGILSLILTQGMDSPSGMAVDRSDNIYVCNRGSSTVIKLSPQGEKIAELKLGADSVCVDDYGYIYVLDSRKGKVREYGPDGNLSGEFGSSGKGHGQFYKPSAILAGKDGLVLVVDTGNKRIFAFRLTDKNKQARLPVSRDMKLLFSGPETSVKLPVGQFTPQPGGVIAAFLGDSQKAVLLDDKGAIKSVLASPDKKSAVHIRKAGGMAWSEKTGLVVSDSDAGKVYIFNSTGGVKAVLGEKAGFFGSSSKEGCFSKPSGVAVSNNGAIFVADSGNARVQQFTSDGMFINALGPELQGATLLAPGDVWWTGKDLLILDRKLKKIVEVDPSSGRVVLVWGEQGERASQLADPVSIAYDGRKFVYVLDKADSRVKVFDGNGAWVASFFAAGTGTGALISPEELHFSGNRLYISDSSGKLEAFAMNIITAPPTDLSGTVKEDRVKLSWKGAQPEWVSDYEVLRSTEPDGFAVAAGTAAQTGFAETIRETPATYYYRICSRSLTGETGQPSEPYMLFVPGNLNVARVELAKVNLNYIFSANYKYYLHNPVGRLTLANNSDVTFKNVKVSFALKDFMDYPSDRVVEEIAPHSKTEVALKGTLNNKILEVSEDTPVQAQISVTYYENGEPKTIEVNQPVKVLSRTAIIWDNAARLANFITPKDTPVLAFARAALNMRSPAEEYTVNPNISTAMLLWSALGELGINYVSDPSKPYASIKSSSEHPLDNVQPPRDTLKLRSGKCSDLVALLSTMLEGAGIHTVFLDYPSHIALAFNTGAADPADIGIPADKMVLYEGTYWIPVESTMIGKDFPSAAREAVRMYTRAGADVKIIDTHKAWADYEPMTLPSANWESPVPEKAAVQARYNADMKEAAKTRRDYIKQGYMDALSKNPDDVDALTGLGMLCVETEDYSGAQESFNKILKFAPENSDALNNMGNVSYMKGSYSDADGFYAKASAADPDDAGILLNRARAAMKLGDKEAAKKFADRAADTDPAFAEAADAVLEIK
ncbi:MAG: tetratricopeptide repeat protein [Elusimicrobiales bacterium]